MKKCISCFNTYNSNIWKCPICEFSPPMVDGFVVFHPELAYENQGFDAKYFEDLAQLEAGNFWFRSRNRLLLWALDKYFPGAESFLEIGCGTGYVLTDVRKLFPDMRVAGSEIFLAGLPHVRKRLPDVPLYQMDARSLPFYGEFDVIGAFDVIEHIDEDIKVLQEINNALRPGGGIMLTIPQHAWLWSSVDDISFHKRRYSRKDILRKIETAGFRIRRITSFVSLLLPTMVLARLRYLIPSQKSNYLFELHLGERINSILEGIMGLEFSFIRVGMNFPFGGSLFVVATKE